MRRVSVGLLAGLAALVGCGENGPPAGPPVGKVYPTAGRVTFADGSPLVGGVITFTPVQVEAGRYWRYEGASIVDAKGNYKAGQNGNGAGLMAGEYKVTVTRREIGELANSNSGRIPKVWQEKGTTPLTATVEEKDNTIDVVLK